VEVESTRNQDQGAKGVAYDEDTGLGFVVSSSPSAIRPVRVWGLPLMPYTLDGSVAKIDEMIRRGEPGFFVTANLHYAMLTEQIQELRALNERASFILADGMPLVWASRLQKTPLPERVAGADLIWRICELAAQRGYRIFLLGAKPGVAEKAADRLRERFPGLTIAGIISPPFRKLTEEEETSLIDEMRRVRPQILLVAFGQPSGELWIARNFERMQIPVAVQVGASIDFVAGNVRRAPGRLQRYGLEWAFRLAQEPRRLIGRYFRNGLFLIRMLFGHTRKRRPMA
jgi:N-acetylglucosaminyldiphosphoundecaprenol N-acetyl-beta-D-mannosaminyltransferase